MPLDEGEVLGIEQMVRTRLAVPSLEGRFRIEQVVMRRTAGHVQVDDAFRLRREVGPGEIQTDRRLAVAHPERGPGRFRGRPGERHAADAGTDPTEERPSGGRFQSIPHQSVVQVASGMFGSSAHGSVSPVSRG